MKQVSFVIFYNDPENYPPTYNGICSLAKRFEKVYVVYRKTENKSLNYPKNVVLQPLQFNVNTKSSLFSKIVFFIRFVLVSKKLIRKYKPSLLLLYDDIALFVLYFLKKLIYWHTFIWFHSHDVLELNKVSKYSLNFFAFKTLSSSFRFINLFTLPSLERLKYFPIENLLGKYTLLQNFPAKERFNYRVSKSVIAARKSEIKLIYQGALGKDHGFEEIINVLGNSIPGMTISLTLVGRIRDEYKFSLFIIAERLKKRQFLNILDRVEYSKLQDITIGHTIGLATHKPNNIIYSTGGTASNKIYEYIACSLPVILYHSENNLKNLEKYDWAFFTDLSNDSILSNIKSILENYDELCINAYSSFLKDLNFESKFNKMYDFFIDEHEK